ncbi:RluA family pseudouridine synthase [Roseicyclus sp. F158]|uniref:Pseudouridine synthase n=1 Tax=Tropicimonas omnivorans TaxID=3075590 RepID=A0ABU3DGK7_9RHOB|nr:RluA family pseudouridine synthase [Roseicyclus sp. F158]MDT0682853.1 RluA family pseudouridine synthase [Roseicyclus sp. F158]
MWVTIGAEPPRRLDKALSRDVPESAALSRSRLARLIEDGHVSLGGAPLTDPRARVAEGDRLRIDVPPPAPTHMTAEDIPLDIAFEDAHLIVVNKPAGMVVHPAPGTPSGTLVNALLGHCVETLSGVGGSARPGIVHRIDKDTSGLLVVAKSDAAHHGLAAQFEAHTADRRYLAICHGAPDPADPRLGGMSAAAWEDGGILRIETRLGRHPKDRQRQAVQQSGGRRAVTRARARETFGTPPAAALLECRLETGRTHQIRVHLSHLGFPLAGDPVYGGRRRAPQKSLGAAAEAMDRFERQALHAATLAFVHPVSEERLSFEAPLPEDMTALLEALRASG